MSRNLASTGCRICCMDSSTIQLEESPRPITEQEVGLAYRARYVGRLVVANAVCTQCGAKYLAWVSHDFPAESGCSRWKREPGGYEGSPPFVDLSFRHAFDDEPAAEDLPTKEYLEELEYERRAKRVADLRESAAKITAVADAIECGPVPQSYWEGYRR